MYGKYEEVIHPPVRVMLEEGPRNWSAYVPAIPGCVATGRNRGDVQREIEAALALHLEALHEDGLRIEAEDKAAESQIRRA